MGWGCGRDGTHWPAYCPGFFSVVSLSAEAHPCMGLIAIDGLGDVERADEPTSRVLNMSTDRDLADAIYAPPGACTSHSQPHQDAEIVAGDVDQVALVNVF